MNNSELLRLLNNLDVRLWVEDGRLRVNAPKGALTPELREALAAQKEEVIQILNSAGSSWLEEESQARTNIVPLSSRKDKYPLSFSQIRLWFMDQLTPNSIAYSVLFAIKLEGMLDNSALKRCINEIVRRHESLRTTFAIENDGQPVQIIHPFTPLEIPYTDLTHFPEAEREPASFEFITQQSLIPFDLNIGPLFRSNLIRLNQDLHYLFINMHHIISDGWSSGVLLSELAALYQAFTSGEENPLPELPIQFVDYAAWQRQSQAAEMLPAQLAYWTQKLNGQLPILELPADHPRPLLQTFFGKTAKITLPGDLETRLKQLCKQQEVTLFMLLLTAYKVLLFRLTGQEDLLVGTPIANRNQKGTETLIGFFVNTLVMRSNLAGNPAFSDILDSVRETAIEAFTNHELPFEHIVEALHPVRDTSHSPIFQVMFILQNLPVQYISFNNLKVSPVYLDGGGSKYDLTLVGWESPEGLTCYFEYNTDLFEAATIERMMSYYQNILEAVCADPSLKIGEIPMVSEAEHRQVLQKWNDTRREYPRDINIHQLFEAQVERTPDVVAVTFEDQSITYHELNRRANCLARHLQELGTQSETLVGICLNRSIDMVVGLLGILKAGGAYIPLDPTFPVDRLCYMLEDSGARLLLTETSLAALMPAQDVRMVCLDSDWVTTEQQTTENLAPAGLPDQLAYVLYTSGSTGRPKGVEVTHRNVVNFLTSMQREPGITAEDILLSVTTLSFDISGLEVYLPLISGARLVLVGSAVAADGVRLAHAMEQSGTTIMQATPATWRILLGADWRGNKKLKILVGGEAFPPDLACCLNDYCGSLWNMYGPTETTIWSTITPIVGPTDVVTIGRPIANTRIYILNGQRLPVPIGAAGELYIGGDGVARGYLNRPELTAEKFLPDPFIEDSHTRMYRTGDLVRYLPDGRILFLGRIDNQVKVRGFRIELGEIETVLNSHPIVQQAVVTVREDTPGDLRLVAYFTYAAEQAPSISELRALLKERLPDYMVPSTYVPLAALPLTPNGKVDRKALPAPETGRPELATSFSAPQSDIERELAAIWHEKLRVEQVGMDDNFFELGGHSLLMVQIHNQVLQQFKCDLSIAEMFQYPTIRSLAQRIQKQPETENGKANTQVLERARLQKAAIERQRRSGKSGFQGGSKP